MNENIKRMLIKKRPDVEQAIYINGEKYVTNKPVIKTEHKDGEISITGFYKEEEK